MCSHFGPELHLFSCIDRREIFLDLLSRQIFMYLKKLHYDSDSIPKSVSKLFVGVKVIGQVTFILQSIADNDVCCCGSLLVYQLRMGRIFLKLPSFQLQTYFSSKQRNCHFTSQSMHPPYHRRRFLLIGAFSLALFI